MAGEYLADEGSEEESVSITSKVETYLLEELGLRLVDSTGFSDSRGLKDDVDIINEVYGEVRKLGGVDGVLAFESCLENIPKINLTFELIDMTFGDKMNRSGLCMLRDCSEKTKKVQNRRLFLLDEC